jgi:hypothetical protein
MTGDFLDASAYPAGVAGVWWRKEEFARARCPEG